jgi:hypothetical protein
MSERLIGQLSFTDDLVVGAPDPSTTVAFSEDF